MKRHPNRRAILFAASTAALAAATGASAAQGAEIRGVIEFATGDAIPKGRLEVYIDGAAGARAAASRTELAIEGDATAVEFALPTSSAEMPEAEIVAELTRADGWLLARGAALAKPGEPVTITLYTVMY